MEVEEGTEMRSVKSVMEHNHVLKTKPRKAIFLKME